METRRMGNGSRLNRVMAWGGGALMGALGLAAGWSVEGTAALQDDPFLGVETLSEAELGERRGQGFLWGLLVAFGANIQSLVDGAPVLETVFVPSGNGFNGTTVASLPSGWSVVSNGDVEGFDAPEGYEGPILQGPNGGIVALLHKFGSNHVGNIVAVTEPNTAAQQTLELSVVVQNFGNVLAAIQQNNIFLNAWLAAQ